MSSLSVQWLLNARVIWGWCLPKLGVTSEKAEIGVLCCFVGGYPLHAEFQEMAPLYRTRVYYMRAIYTPHHRPKRRWGTCGTFNARVRAHTVHV